MTLLGGLKRQFVPKGLRREAENLQKRVLARVTGERLRRDLAQLGIAEGDLLCVHSKLSALGYVVGGPGTVLEALRDLVGERGTLTLPTFCGGNSTYAYVQSGPPPFDPARTPTTCGALSEHFRVQPGVRRSLHPTHSVAAQGPLGEELTRGHESSPTPFGTDTPYARLVGLGGKILLLGVNANSVLHYVEELVDWPNHWADEVFRLPVVTPEATLLVSTRVHRPGPFSHVLLPGRRPGQHLLLHHPSHALPFCLSPKEERIYGELRPDVALGMERRREDLVREDIVRLGAAGQGPAAILNAAGFSEEIRADLEEHFADQRGSYRPEVLAQVFAESRAV